MSPDPNRVIECLLFAYRAAIAWMSTRRRWRLSAWLRSSVPRWAPKWSAQSACCGSPERDFQARSPFDDSRLEGEVHLGMLMRPMKRAITKEIEAGLSQYLEDT